MSEKKARYQWNEKVVDDIQYGEKFCGKVKTHGQWSQYLGLRYTNALIESGTIFEIDKDDEDLDSENIENLDGAETDNDTTEEN